MSPWWTAVVGCSLAACEPPGDPRVQTSGVRPCSAPRKRALEPYVITTHGKDWVTVADHGTPEWDFLQGARGVSVDDFDGDGHLDMLVPRDGFETRLLQGDGSGGFTDVSEDRFSNRVVLPVFSSSTADYDNDGDVDVMMNGVESDAILMRNDGAGSLTPRAMPDWNVDGSPLGCGGVGTWADYDRDGDLDLFYGRLGGTFPETGEPIRCQSTLLRNDGGVLVPDPEPLAELLEGFKVIGAVWDDFDGNGWPDLYAITDHPNRAARLIRNLGDSRFDSPRNTGLEILAFGMGIGLGDVNSDDRPDVVVPDIGRVWLLESRIKQNQWTDAATRRGLVPDRSRGQSVAWGGELADLDNDGWLDVLVTYSPAASSERGFYARVQPDEAYRGGPDGYEAVGPSWRFDNGTVNRGVLAVDLDDDGWLDIIKRELGGMVTVHHARCGAESWVSVALDDATTDNRSGIGAIVTVEAGGRRHRRTVAAGGHSYAVSGPPRVHVGLGSARRIDDLTITWPDGEVVSYGGFRSRQALVVAR